MRARWGNWTRAGSRIGIGAIGDQLRLLFGRLAVSFTQLAAASRGASAVSVTASLIATSSALDLP